MNDILEQRIRELQALIADYRSLPASVMPYFADFEREWQIELRAFLRLQKEVERVQADSLDAHFDRLDQSRLAATR